MEKNNGEPIRIAHIIGKWIGGGVESVVMNYYRYIDKAKIQFDFICDEDSSNIPYNEIESLGGKVILIPPYQKISKYQKELKRILIEGKYKIVHSHINTLSVFPLRAAKKANVQVRIAHSHSTSNKKEWKKNIIKNVLRPFSKKYATEYFCCSELAGRYLFGNKTYNEGKVYLLNNAINLEKFRYKKEIRNIKRKELNIDEDTLVIGHVGRFVTQKNHTFLIDVFNEIHKRNLKSILILVGQGNLQEKIRQKVNKLGLGDSVKFLGQREDVNEIYQAIDVFILPSLYEGLGMVLIEAQCAGSYCIASTEVTTATKVSNNIDFLKLDDSPEKWATKALNAINKYERKEQTEQCEKAGYNICIEANKLEQKYYEFLRGK